VNFRIYWDGTAQDQLFDGGYDKNNLKSAPVIQKWTGSSFTNVVELGTSTYNSPQTCNTTKATPCLQADFLGDWREELVMWSLNDPSQVMIYTTWTPTDYAVPTLMHDHVYRMGVAWQNTAYNQPPHLGYFLPDYLNGRLPSSVPYVAEIQQQTAQQYYDLQGRRSPTPRRGLSIVKTVTDQGIKTQKLYVR
jgi:rhamnogalacturonan endolyase